MIIIPHYVIVLIPILAVWWTHRRGTQREYWLLVGSVLIVCIPLLVLSYYRHMTCTWHRGPCGPCAGGIKTVQIPLSILVAAAIAAIPMKWKLVRNFVAILAGEMLLMDRWVS
jgi:hypothetical protein